VSLFKTKRHLKYENSFFSGHVTLQIYFKHNFKFLGMRFPRRRILTEELHFSFYKTALIIIIIIIITTTTTTTVTMERYDILKISVYAEYPLRYA
jgi:hypothetical protein